MTTLAEGRAEALAALEQMECKDGYFLRKLMDQVWTMTTGSNPYFVWEDLPEDEKWEFGSVEHHPKGHELCEERWMKTGAFDAWGNDYGTEAQKKTRKKLCGLSA